MLEIVPIWSPYEGQSGVGWQMDKISGTPPGVRIRGWKVVGERGQSLIKMLGTALRRISRCEDNVERNSLK